MMNIDPAKMQSRCLKEGCTITGEFNGVVKHCKKDGHMYIGGYDPMIEYTNPNEVIELYRRNLIITMIKKLTADDVDNLFEEIECDRKDFRNIHCDTTTDILDDYGRTKLRNEVIADVKKALRMQLDENESSNDKIANQSTGNAV